MPSSSYTNPLMTTHLAMVAGFMFNPELTHVALIRKNKPEWQKGKLNGIGGKIEPTDFGSVHAMRREFEEETGFEDRDNNWRYFLHMKGCQTSDNFSVDFFTRTGDLSLLKTMEAEPIEIVSVDSIRPHRPDIVDNLPWLVSLAINHLQTGRPSFVTVEYP